MIEGDAIPYSLWGKVKRTVFGATVTALASSKAGEFKEKVNLNLSVGAGATNVKVDAVTGKSWTPNAPIDYLCTGMMSSRVS